MKNEINYLTMAMSLIALAMSFLTFQCNLLIVGMCYGAALVLIIIYIILKINRKTRNKDSNKC
ncbi:hypothetical protein ABSDF1317 [Acinetobacter baumannii SDF]|uniref:Uncharacterized protein n=1 Tax=Acinetobacter baumannii (strain SDF) TaxID=509170 RepID=B0VKG0_ACIBS|nr:hypothetical protein ABSDF1317 [Acinetobacter baumannii SDF]